MPQLYETSPEGARLQSVEAPEFQPGLPDWYGGQSIVLEPRVRYQRWLGFGGAFTEAAAWTLQHLDEAAQDAVLRGYFHPTEGLGYRFGRTHINSCDFSLENWACAEVPGDLALEHFSLERTHRHITPMIQRALAVEGAQIDLIASPWSPPAWMKSNGQMNHGGKLLEECRETWARHYVRWIEGMRQAGVSTWAITVQNEPAATQIWDSCRYTAAEERDFIRDFLGPALHAAGLEEVRIITWDHNRDIAFQRAATVLADEEAAKYVWGVGVHWYAGDYFNQLAQIRRRFPDTHLLLTEACWEGGVKLGHYDRAGRYAHHIIGDLNHGCEAWVDWNLVLDQSGGPNHVGNLCDAPIIVNTETGEVTTQASFHAIGHFSRFLRRGAERIGRSYVGGPLESTAFANPDGSLVCVVHNPSQNALPYRLLTPEGGIEAHIGAWAIQTWVLEARD